ncbi:MAG: NAD(P)H-dependent oxidoreductase [Selenomonadaceae bacterium]|nr:NAD(P)H-dependent oxidoreductase [Selenomonadaceae bacterium]
MKKLFAMLLTLMMSFTLTACNGDEKSADSEKISEKNKILVAYFSCTGSTKNLAETSAEILKADLYEIKPAVPYTTEDLNYKDETTRATVEQRNQTARPELADKNANIGQYDIIVIAYPIWWHTAPKIIETFLESYDFSGKKILPICTSGGSDIIESVDNLKNLPLKNVQWLEGKCFFKNPAPEQIKAYFGSVNLQ